MPLRTSDQCDISEWAPITSIMGFGMSIDNVQYFFQLVGNKLIMNKICYFKSSVLWPRTLSQGQRLETRGRGHSSLFLRRLENEDRSSRTHQWVIVLSLYEQKPQPPLTEQVVNWAHSSQHYDTHWHLAFLSLAENS